MTREKPGTAPGYSASRKTQHSKQFSVSVFKTNGPKSFLKNKDLTSMDLRIKKTPLSSAPAQHREMLGQGDTTTVFCAALAAFYNRIPVGHVEAALRAHNLYSPWPEK